MFELRYSFPIFVFNGNRRYLNVTVGRSINLEIGKDARRKMIEIRLSECLRQRIQGIGLCESGRTNLVFSRKGLMSEELPTRGSLNRTNVQHVFDFYISQDAVSM